jgi:8-oxo-dGTP diphosphatase
MLEKYIARAIILNKNEEILLNRRASGHLEGKWEIPGGLIEPGEHPRDAAIREVFEETGLIFDAKSLFKKDVQRTPDSIFTWKIHYYSGDATGQLHLDPNEVSEAEYVSQHNLNNYDFTFLRLKETIHEYYRARQIQPTVIKFRHQNRQAPGFDYEDRSA